MDWNNCEDHYKRESRKNDKMKPMDTRTKIIVAIWLIFLGIVIWLVGR